MKDVAVSHKIDYVTFFYEILNLKGHPNCITGLNVRAILLNRWILPIGVIASGRVCACAAGLYVYKILTNVFLNTTLY